MFGLLSVVAAACTGYQIIKEAFEPTIPAENWSNKELYYKDLMSDMSDKERMKNVRNGKYILNEPYQEPHRTKDGKIFIENSKLYNEDIKKYGVHQTYKWVRQGKYNLTPAELKKEYERIENEDKHKWGR